MTPLSRLLGRYLPPRAVPFALALAYGLGLLSIWLCMGTQPLDLLYLDLPERP